MKISQLRQSRISECSNIDFTYETDNYTTIVRDFCKSWVKIQTSNSVWRFRNCSWLFSAGFSDELRQGKLDQRMSVWSLGFENRYEARLGLRKIDETLATSCKSKNIFRKRIEKRSVRFKISNTIPESFRLFVPHEKSELSEEKTIQTILVAISQRYRKFSILATRCCVNSNFLNLCKVTDGIMVISSKLVVWIFVPQSL